MLRMRAFLYPCEDLFYITSPTFGISNKTVFDIFKIYNLQIKPVTYIHIILKQKLITTLHGITITPIPPTINSFMHHRLHK